MRIPRHRFDRSGVDWRLDAFGPPPRCLTSAWAACAGYGDMDLGVSCVLALILG